MNAVRLGALAGLACIGCSDGALRSVGPTRTPIAPVLDEDRHGGPPDWSDCDQAFLGDYVNRSADTEYLAFSRWDGSLDFGVDWWPVDDGLAEDPADFDVTWRSWMRAWSDTTWTVAFGAASSAELWVDGEVVAAVGGLTLAPELFAIDVDAGQHTVDVRFSHVGAGTSALSLRTVDGDVSLCAGAW